MGFIADEPLGDLLDEQGLDHAGKSLREQQRKAQAIDRDLPDNTGIDDHITDAFSGVDYGKLLREVQARQSSQQKAIEDAMVYGTGVNWVPKGVDPRLIRKGPMTATDAKRLQDCSTGRDRFTVKGKYAHLDDKGLEEYWHKARADGNHNHAKEIKTEAERRRQEKADG